MNNLKNSRIKSYWQGTPELFSEKYEWNISRLFSPTSLFLDARRRKVLKLAGKIQNKKILDLGCGSGIFMVDFIKRGACVTGVDYSQKMLELAQQLLKNYRISKNLYSLQKAKASDIKFQNESFNLALATGLTDYIPLEETEKLLFKLSKILKRDGAIIISFPSTQSPFSFLRKGIGLTIRQKLFRLPPIASTFTEYQIRQLLKKYGFKIEEISKIYFAMWIVKAKHSKYKI